MILDMLYPNSTKAPVHANLDQCIEILKDYRPKKAHIGSAGWLCWKGAPNGANDRKFTAGIHKKRLLEKEDHLNQTSPLLCSMLIFRGVFTFVVSKCMLF